MKLHLKIIDSFYSIKRLKKKSKRQSIKLAKHKFKYFKRNQVSARFGRRSKVINMLGRYGTHRFQIHKNRIEINLGQRFSIIENPESSINLLVNYAQALDSDPDLREIRLHYADLENYNLAANALLDLITKEKTIENRGRRSKNRLQVKGNYPKDKSVKLFIKSMGIIKHLDIQHEALPTEEAEKIIFYDYRSSHYYQDKDGRKAGIKENKITGFVDYVQRCLNQRGFRLTEFGKAQLVIYTGELLSNAEEHSGFTDWTIQGYLDESEDVSFCELVIFNFGRSIAETILEARETNSYLNELINPYIEKHKENGFFGKTWSEEDLCTVIALQANVSTKNHNKTDTQGQGTIDMIRFFEQINRFCSKDKKSVMALLSGSTHILFDGKYSLLNREGAGAIIAFNESNSLDEKPDSNYVRNLNEAYFPGTIISIKFPIKSSSLFEETTNEQYDN